MQFRIINKLELRIHLSSPIFTLWDHYTKYDIYCLIIFDVIIILPCSTLILFNAFIISVRGYARRYVGIHLLSLLFFVFHILTDTKFKHVTSTYYHSWYLMYEFTINVACFHRVIDIWCMHFYLVYQTLNIIFSIHTFQCSSNVNK